MDAPKVSLIKTLYLYLVSFVALMMVVFSVADVVNIVLRTYVFTKADADFYNYPQPVCPPTKPLAPDATSTNTDCGISAAEQTRQAKQNEENKAAQKQRDLVRDISMIVVGVPLFMYHWRLTRKKE